MFLDPGSKAGMTFLRHPDPETVTLNLFQGQDVSESMPSDADQAAAHIEKAFYTGAN
jgi:hypothetical protein